MAIADLPQEIQEEIQNQAAAFNQGDPDTIDTPDEMRALQKLLLGLDPSVVQANPQVAQMQQAAQTTMDPMLLIEMIKNQLGEFGQNGGGGRDLGPGGLPSPGGMSSRGPGAWNPSRGGGGGSGGGGGNTSTAAASGPAQSSYPAGNLDGDRSAQAMSYLQQELGITAEQAAGIVGNLGVESGGSLDPTAIGDNGNAMGIAQWNGPRMAALKSFAAQQGKPATDFGVQLQFLAHELKTSESGSLAALRRTNTASEAALSFSQNFERPGIPHNDRRMALAEQALRINGNNAALA